jgi:hypothetical protein
MFKPRLRTLTFIVVQRHKDKAPHSKAIRYAYPIVTGIPSQVKVQVDPVGQLKCNASMSLLLFQSYNLLTMVGGK